MSAEDQETIPHSWKEFPSTYSDGRLARRPAENVAIKLWHRERDGGGRRGTHWIHQRSFHSSIFPNTTVANIEKPLSFLRKFSPDGSVLVAFNGQQSGVEVYEFKGVQAAGSLVQTAPDQFLCDGEDDQSVRIRQNIFKKLFTLKFAIPVISRPGSEQLNRECSLFTSDSRHLIVAGAGPGAELDQEQENSPDLGLVYQSPDSLPITSALPPEQISIFSLCLETGRLCDRKVFKCDKIFLSHNQGLYLLDRLLAILSVQHQTVHLFQIDKSSGKMIPLHSIGRFLFDDDQLCLRSFAPADPLTESVYGGLKHRLLALCYRKAAQQSRRIHSNGPLQRFYQQLPIYHKLKLCRMQLLDQERLLFRMASEDVILARGDIYSSFSIFVLYNFRSCEIEQVFDSTAPQLLEAYERLADFLRHPAGELRFPCSLSSNQDALEQYSRYKRTILTARGGGGAEAVRRVLSQLPICAQSFSPSPYLDLSLFSYDDKLVSMLERPKTCSDAPLRFYSRRNHQLRFQLHCGGPNPPGGPHAQSRRLVAFIFHPSEPLIISVQRSNRDYLVNLHLPKGTLP